MAQDLKLQVILQALDKASGPLGKIRGASKGVGEQVKKTRESLRQLDQAQKSIGEWRKLRAGTRELEQRMRGTQQRAGELGKQLADARQRAALLGTGSRGAADQVAKLATQFDQARKESAALKGEFAAQQAKLQAMRSRLREAGIDTRQLGTAERTLRSDTASATARLKQQTDALRAQAVQAQRVAAMHERLAKSQTLGANLSIGGYASLETGRRLLGALAPGIHQSSEWASETQRYATLGLGSKALADAQKLAKSMHYAGTSVVDNLELIRDAAAVFANQEHAAMAAPIMARLKFANDTLYGQASGEARTRQFQDMLKVIDLRGGTLSQKSFNAEANAVQQVFNATAGRVAPEEWRALIQRGGVAAKLLDRKAFYYGMEPLVQEMGGASAGAGLMSLYQNLYQGKSTVRAASEMARVGLLDPGKVEYTKIGTIKQIRAGALRGGDLFTTDPQKWLETVMLPALAAHGITSRKDVLNEIGAIVGNRRGANLLSAMYTQRAQIARSRNLSEHADDIDASAAKAALTPAGRLIQMHKQLDNLYTEIGNDLLPVYIAALRRLTGVLRAMTSFAQRHPALAKGIALVAAGMGALAVAAGGVMITLGGLIGQFALLRFAVERSGLGTVLKWIGSGALKAIPVVTRGAMRLAGVLGGVLVRGIRLAGMAIVGLGRAMLANPILLIIGLIAGAAYLIWRNWDTIRPRLQAFWAGLKRVALEAWEAIRSMAGTAWAAITAPFQALMSLWSAGWRAAQQAFRAVWDTIKSTALSVIKAITDKIDQGLAKWRAFKSHFTGGPVGQALAVVGDRRQTAGNRVKAGAAALGMAALAGVNPAIAAGTIIGSADSAKPITAARTSTTTVTHHMPITIVQQPGQSPHSVARAVGDEIDRRQRAQAAAGRSRLGDPED